MKKIVFLIALLGSYSGFSQSIYDAVSILTLRSNSTARVSGVGGAYGSAGPEIGAISINPATLGMYRSDVFSFTPSLGINRSNTTFNDNETSLKKSNFGISSIGFVKGRDFADSNSKLKSINYGFTFNRNNSFREYFAGNGLNSNNSYVDYFAAQANDSANSGRTIDFLKNNAPFCYESALASASSLITNTSSIDFMPVFNGGLIRQSVVSYQKGNQFDFTFSMGGNINDKFYWGGALFGQYFRVNYSNTYKETDEKDTITYLKDFTFNTNSNMVGFGVGFQVGGIYVPRSDWRLGFSARSRTNAAVSETFSTSLDANLDGFGSIPRSSSPDFSNSYIISMPGKVLISATKLMGKIGFLSMDLDYTNAAKVSFKSNQDPFIYESFNRSIKNQLGGAMGLRLGGEYRFSPKFYGRSGFRYQSMGWKNHDNTDNNRYALSVGAGIKTENEFFDFALVQGWYKTGYQQYNGYGVSGATAQAKILPLMFMITMTTKI
jgi:hypothetical protein